ncbi:UTP--glucose-1-phosphate uridylyltransferase GalU [Ktedonospora formicarum]|uniref:UTP--glucose-1-phosphate uridylyltransferase n=1 Tax=Ktedonospora formicarum TaxID=2778364 RepID=A0A8J3MR20_9CHLR|nr:UTP--glucose-1-phosphate uridylyltransferase GalU [Ktedonospora formicarum]GHO44575.1 UTP--glucose-1-phosphate uridylyltransferase [Ktedonospora formicarum]
MSIRKAVMPVAGLGTRVLPASKVIPKEMLPLVDRPTLQYIVEEAVEAGIEEVIFVTSSSKRSIEDHFDSFPDLERTLERKGKFKELEELRRVQNLAQFAAVRQPEALGLGHAVLCAKHLVGDEPFVVMLGDDLVAPETPCLPRMMELFERYQSSVISLFEVPKEEISKFGIVAGESVDGEQGFVKIAHMVEKPDPEEAPSNLAVAGRYVLTPDIFELLEKTKPGKGGEIQLTDALQAQAQEGRCFGMRFDGERFDTGNPLGLLKTSIAYALKRPELASELRAYMQSMLEYSKSNER